MESRWPAPMAHMDDAETPEQAWEFWKPLVTNEDGTLNEEAVRVELSDFSMLLRYYSVILCEVTGNHISIPTTHPSNVVARFHDYMSERIEEAVKDEIEANELVSLLREARDYLADTDPASEFLERIDAALGATHPA